jgi:hypothetical protein
MKEGGQITAQQIKDLAFLDALEAMGVDNWEGYGEAQELINNQ